MCAMSMWQRVVRLFRSWFSSGDDMGKLSARLDDTYRQQTQLLQQVQEPAQRERLARALAAG